MAMKEHPNHKKHLDALKRIEGQVRGIQKMVEERRYCVDILTQLSAVSSAVASVQNSVLERHLDTCVKTAFESGTDTEKKKKLTEVVRIIKNFRKN